MRRGDEPIGVDDTKSGGSEQGVIVWAALRGETHRLELAAGETLFKALARAELDPPFSCLAGYCSECVATLESGQVEMRINKALTPKQVERGLILTCQSLPRSSELRIRFD
jgi:ferredoxin